LEVNEWDVTTKRRPGQKVRIKEEKESTREKRGGSP
jgi:hypothetical protein